MKKYLDYDGLVEVKTKIAENILDLKNEITSLKQIIGAYSTQEQKIGTWIDGKSLYQKTITIDAFPSSAGNVEQAHNISNIDTITETIGIAVLPSSSTGTVYPLPYIDSTTANFMNFTVNKTNVILSAGKNRSSWKGYITLKYTKTTD